MTEEHTDFYKGLAIYILPEGVTDYFDLVDFNEEPAQKGDQLYKKELHLYLDERDSLHKGVSSRRETGAIFILFKESQCLRKTDTASNRQEAQAIRPKST